MERVVPALKAVDRRLAVIETGEREPLSASIDAVLTAAGVDVTALTARRHVRREERPEPWREW